jgi:CubicO group peptidase (beta-lactamase class C family)
MHRWFICLGLTAVLTMPLAAQELPPRGPLARAIDQLVTEAGVTEETPGVAICIVQPGKWTFSKGYGLANLKEKTPITANTRFELASLGKPLTAIGVLILHDRSQLSLDDDIRKHLPELPVYDKSQPIKISHLLQHTSGLPDYMQMENVPAKNKDWWTNADYLPEFAKQQKAFPLTFATGQKYQYNNSNYMLLALLIERASGKSYADFMRDEVFLPAGMKETFVYHAPSAAPQGEALTTCALGYTRRPRGWVATWGLRPSRKETLLTYGDGAIWSSLEDLAKWDAALRSGKYLKPATAKKLLQPSRTRDGQTNQYGLGFVIYPGEKEGQLNGFGHDGDWGGFKTSYYQYTAADRTTIILSNKKDFDPDKFWYKLNDAIEAKRASR